MAKTDGYSQYACDRCDRTIYALEGAPATQQWREVRHVGADGVDQSRLLCPGCVAEYRDFAQGQDRDFNEFMAGGEA